MPLLPHLKPSSGPADSKSPLRPDLIFHIENQHMEERPNSKWIPTREREKMLLIFSAGSVIRRVWLNPGCWWQNISLPDSSLYNHSLLLRQLFWERLISSGGKPLEQCWQNVVSNMPHQEFPMAWGPHLLVSKGCRGELQQPWESFPEEGRESVPLLWEFRGVSPYFTI